MEHPVIRPHPSVRHTQHNCIVQAGGIALRAHLQHTAVIARAVLPRRKRGRTDVAALKYRSVRGAVVIRAEVYGRIQIALDGQIARHGVAGLFHAAKSGNGFCRSGRSRTSALNVQRLGQLQRPAKFSVAGGLRHFAKSDAGTVRQEVHDNALRADGNRLFYIIEIVLQAHLQVIAGQRIECLRQHLVRFAQII